MISALLLLVLAQVVPCTPGETSVVCECKQGMMSACEVLVGEDAAKAEGVLDELLGALEHAVRMAEEGKRQKLQAAAQALSQVLAVSEPPNCGGQQHHTISRPIAAELSRHKTLTGLYKPRDTRFVAQAKDEQAHCGYQDWHRKVDKEVIDWLRENKEATPKQFEDKLREIYNRPEMRERFPHGP